MDRPLDPTILRRRRSRLIIQAGAVLLVLIAGFLFLSAWISPSVKRTEIRTATVDSGLVEAMISATGVVVPEFEEVISSPTDTRVLQVLRHPGEKLKKGDKFLLLDMSEERLALERTKDKLVLEANKATQLKLDQERTLADLQSQLRVKELNLTYLKSKSAQQQRLLDIGASSRDQLDQAKLQEDIARTEKEALEQSISTAQHSLKNQLEGNRTEIETLRKEEADIERQLAILSCRASREGVLTKVVQDIGATIRQGDELARIADLNAYRVDAEASDIHATEISVGMPVHIVTNARTLRGSVSHINPAMENGVMKFSVALAGDSLASLRANLRVDVAVVTARRGVALRLPSGPYLNGNGAQDVFVVRGNRADRTNARFGVSGIDYVEVLAGLKKGDEVVISDVRDYLHVKEIRIK